MLQKNLICIKNDLTKFKRLQIKKYHNINIMKVKHTYKLLKTANIKCHFFMKKELDLSIRCVKANTLSTTEKVN